MRRPTSVLAITTVAGIWLSSGCTGYRHHQWQNVAPLVADNGEYVLQFLEVDDEGWFWKKDQAASALKLVEDSVEKRDTIVVLFVHGWHHSAECCDDNVEAFRATLKRLHVLKPQFKMVGIYVGWRGQSLPMPLDYLTFWGRKSAAERVGENDLKEFIARLQKVYTDYRPDARQTQSDSGIEPAQKNFLGMVMIGHSFGAQVLFKAVAGPLEQQLVRINESPAYLRDAELATPVAGEQFTVTGIGDLVILINPALEASQFHRLYILSHGIAYSRYQTPVILTLSAENDKARHKFFSTGRVLGEIFTGKPRKANDVQRAVERQALGVYAGHVTHRLTPVDDPVASISASGDAIDCDKKSSLKLISTSYPGDVRDCKGKTSCKVTWREWKTNPTETQPNSLTPGAENLASFDFGNDVVFNSVKLLPLTESRLKCLKRISSLYGEPQLYQPYIVAETSKNIIDDHSGIFTEPFVQFLVPYIAYIEEKSKLNRRDKYEQRQREMRSLK